jgi:hypothetical protein
MTFCVLEDGGSVYVCIQTGLSEYTASHPGDYRMQAQNVSIDHTFQIKMNISEKHH